MDTVMKRAIFAVIFCLAAASTAAAADDTLAGLIQAGNRDAALKRIAAGADVNAAQGDGTTPLHWAVYKIDADLARALLERGAKPDVINNYGSSPLAEAVKVANARLVGMLLDAGSNVEEPNQEACLSGCHPQPLGLVFGHAHGRSPAWRSSVPTIAPRVPATFS